MNIQLSSYRVEIAQYDEHKLDVKFIICDFDPNLNEVMLNRQTIDGWISTLLNQPVVAKLSEAEDGQLDFTGHNVKIVQRQDENGNWYEDIEFDTSAFGTYTSVGIEEIDGKEYIVANAEIWRRFKNVSDLILERVKNGGLSTSWEIAPKSYHFAMVNGRSVKVIDDGRFIGNTLLGRYVPPAYPSAQIIQVASNESNSCMSNEFNDAITKDILVASQKEGEIVAKDKVNIATEIEKENMVENTNIENASLTEYDLRKKLIQAARLKTGKYLWISFHFPLEKKFWAELDDRESELDYIEFSYQVDENDMVVLSDPFNVKLSVSVSSINNIITENTEKLNTVNNSLIKASDTIQDLEKQIEELKIYKDKFEQAEQEKIQAEQEAKKAELSQYAVKSGFITSEELESEDIKVMIEKIDEAGIKALIAERFMKQLDEKSNAEIEISENIVENAKTDIVNVNDMEEGFSVSNWLKK